MSHPIPVADATFASSVEQAEGLTLVDFWAPWCVPCLLLGPVLDRVARDYAGRVRIAKLNVDESPATADRFRVRSIPCLILFRDGRQVDEIVGLVPRQRIDAVLTSHLAEIDTPAA